MKSAGSVFYDGALQIEIEIGDSERRTREEEGQGEPPEVHHSDYENETNTNWSSLLSVWDYLHGTIRLDVLQQAISIGVPAFGDPKKLTLGKILAMPFRRRKEDWRRPDGSLAVRPHIDGRTRLEP